MRKEREVTLAALSETTGISVSTLSRLESACAAEPRTAAPPIAQAHQVPLDELVGAPPVGDPGCAPPIVRHGRTHWPLTRQPGGLQAFKVLEPSRQEEPDPPTHEGYEWLYVLSGRLRLVLGDHDVVPSAGRPAPSSTPGCRALFGLDGGGAAEFLSLFGPWGADARTGAARRRVTGRNLLPDRQATA